jgi:hypothetical protein
MGGGRVTALALAVARRELRANSVGRMERDVTGLAPGVPGGVDTGERPG